MPVGSLPVTWTITCYGVLAAIVVGGGTWAHFSWINIGAFGAYSFAEMLGYGHHFYWLIMACQLQVITSVVFMAYLDCDVFESSFAKYGALVYIPANFTMHYAISVFMYTFATKSHIRCGTQRAIRQIWIGFAVYLCWYYFENPWDVYGCRLPSVLGVFGALSIDVAVMLFAALANHDDLG
jgi:hypothetical protein